MAFYYNITTKIINNDTGAEISEGVNSAVVDRNGYYNNPVDLTIGGAKMYTDTTTGRHLHYEAEIVTGWTFVKFKSVAPGAYSSSERVKECANNPMGPLDYHSLASTSTNISTSTALAVTLSIYVSPPAATQYTITYDANGGTPTPSPQTVDEGTTVTLPLAPTKSGYTFIGWKIGSSTYQAGGNYTVNSNVTAVAQWISGTGTVTVYFNANGGTTPMASKTCTVGSPYGTLPTPTWTGHVCIGWYTQRSGGEEVNSSTIVTNTSSHTLYAQWLSSGSHLKYDTSTTTIRLYNPPHFLFKDQMTTIPIGLPDEVDLCPSPRYLMCVLCRNETMSQTYDTSYITLFKRTTATGYYINATGAIGSSSISVANEPDFHVGQLGYYIGVSYTPDRVILSFDGDMLKNIGYKSYGWFWGTRDKEGGSTHGYLNGITDMHLQTGETLDIPRDWLRGTDWKYAVFCMPLVRKISYIVVFNPNGGIIESGTYFKRIYREQTYGEMPTPTKGGSGFNGWWTAQEGGTQIFPNTELTNYSDHTLYAHWTVDAKTSTLYFNANFGTVSPASKTITEGQAVGTLPTPSRSGYTFGGWFNAVGGEQITASTVAGVRDIYAVASWSGNALTINLDANGGTVTPTSVSRNIGEQFGILPTPTRDGYSFAGWWTTAEGGVEIKSADYPTENTTIYAHWTISSSVPITVIKYRINLELNGGTLSPDYECKYIWGIGKPLPTASEITKSGSTFGGWFANPDFSGSPVAAILTTDKGTKTFYAKWV